MNVLFTVFFFFFYEHMKQSRNSVGGTKEEWLFQWQTLSQEQYFLGIGRRWQVLPPMLTAIIHHFSCVYLLEIE